MYVITSSYTNQGYFRAVLGSSYSPDDIVNKSKNFESLNGKFLLVVEAISAIGTRPHIVCELATNIFNHRFIQTGLQQALSHYQSRQEIEVFMKERFNQAAYETDAAIVAVKKTIKLREFESCSLTCAYIYDNDAYIGSIGRCQAHLIHNNKITQITTDHTRDHYWVLRALGNPLKAEISAPDDIALDFHAQPLVQGDIIMLCSYQVREILSQEQLLRHLSVNSHPKITASNIADDIRANDYYDPNSDFSLVIAKIEE
jgi:serine/threonine protein phosphatase PrpC